MKRMYTPKAIKLLSKEEIIQQLESGHLNINAENVTGDSIIENMSDIYSYVYSEASPTFTPTYIGVVKNGNKLTCVWAGTFTFTDETSLYLGRINVPTDSVGSKIVPFASEKVVYNTIAVNDIDNVSTFSQQNYYIDKRDTSNNISYLIPRIYTSGLDNSKTWYVRIEITLLLSDSLAE